MRSEYTDWANTGRTRSNWVRKASVGLALLAPLSLAAVRPAAAATTVIGTESAAGDTAIPFGASVFSTTYPLEYQQIFKPGDFSGPTVINSLGFASVNDGFNAGGLASFPGLTLSLGTTAFNPANTSFVGGLTQVFGGPGTTTATLSPSSNQNAFDLAFPTTPFLYNPASGSLVLDVKLSSAPTLPGGANYTFRGDNSGTTFTRVATISGTNVAANGGVVTQFGVITPESSGATNMAGALLAVGLGALVIRLRRKTNKTSA